MLAKCPSCGGFQTTPVGPGRYKCNGVVTYFESVLVEDLGAQLAWGHRGHRYEDVPRSRPCREEFFVATETHMGEICQGTSSGTTCGEYAVAICQGPDCGRPVGSRHATYHNDRVLCDRCMNAIRAADRARRSEQEAQAIVERAAEARRQMSHIRVGLESSAASVALGAIRRLATALEDWNEQERRTGHDRVQAGLRFSEASGPALANPYGELRDLVLPAWRTFASDATKARFYDVMTVDGWRPGSILNRGDVATQRVPCWMTCGTKEAFSFGERHSVRDPWVLTATEHLHVDEEPPPPWKGWHLAPSLRGRYVVLKGALPKPTERSGWRYLYQCYKVIGRRPLEVDDVLSLTRRGHECITAMAGRKPEQFTQLS